MATSLYGGYVPQPGRWTNGHKIGHVNTPPIEFVIDETLPVLGQDKNFPNRDFIVVPPGRIVAAKATSLTRLFGTTVLTLANGVDPLDAPAGLTGNIPFGYAPYALYRDFSGLPADKPLGVMHETINVPYTTTNESYNTSSNGGSRLVAGEWLMPYFGSVTETTGIFNHRGKLVRFLPKKVYSQVGTASGTWVLDSARFPAFKPRIILAFNAAGGFYSASGATLAWDTVTDRWTATFASFVPTTVVYEYGAAESQRIAQCIGIEPVGTAGGINASSHELAGWLKWVTDNFGAWDWPPIMNVSPSTSVTDEVVTLSSNAGTLAQFPVVPFKAITVKVTGTLTDENGLQTTLSGTELSLADENFFNDFTQGQYYDIDFLTGAITVAPNLSVTAITVSYYYETDFKDGLQYDAGIIGLTNGRDSGIVGLPPHLDVAGVIGVLRAMILP